LRALALDLNLSAHGVDVTVTRPAPDDTAIATRGIWLTTETVDVPAGEFSRREPRRVMALRRANVPTVPRGTLIEAPEKSGDAVTVWRVDGIDRLEADHVRVIVLPVGDDE
jgi:hypothetical protein